MIPRNDYLENILNFRDKQLIKVVTGIRRCGKSPLLELLSGVFAQRRCGTRANPIV